MVLSKNRLSFFWEKNTRFFAQHISLFWIILFPYTTVRFWVNSGETDFIPSCLEILKRLEADGRGGGGWCLCGGGRGRYPLPQGQTSPPTPSHLKEWKLRFFWESILYRVDWIWRKSTKKNGLAASKIPPRIRGRDRFLKKEFSFSSQTSLASNLVDWLNLWIQGTS